MNWGEDWVCVGSGCSLGCHCPVCDGCSWRVWDERTLAHQYSLLECEQCGFAAMGDEWIEEDEFSKAWEGGAK